MLARSARPAAAPAIQDEMRAVFARVADKCDLPPLPAVTARAVSLIQDPDATADDMARLVATDATLAARVLRIANSAIYLRRTPPRTLQDAIVTVGFGGLRQILLAASVRSIYRVEAAVARTLWEHALAASLAADELAVVAGERRGGDSFLAGLMHDVGRLVLHIAEPAAFARLATDPGATEEGVFGVTHAAVGACLAHQWGLHDEIVGGILSHHDPAATALARRIATADRIAHQIGFGTFVAPDRIGDLLDDAEVVAACAARIVETFDSQRTLFE